MRRASVLLLGLALGCSSPEPNFADQRAFDHNRAGAEAFQRGDAAAAALHFERALELARALGERRAACDAENNLGIVLESIGREDEALARYEAARALAYPASTRTDTFVDVHWPGALATDLNLARLAVARGDHTRAAEALAGASRAAEMLATDTARVDVAKQATQAAFARDGATDAVAALAEDAVRGARELDRDASGLAREADAQLVLARVRLARREHEAALEHGLRAAELARAVSDRGLVAGALETLGDVDAALGRATEARERYELALEVHVRRPNLARARAAAARCAELAVTEGREDLAEVFRAKVLALTPAAAGP